MCVCVCACCRHGILITVLRPWYTFDVVTFAPISLQNVTADEQMLEIYDADAAAGAPKTLPSPSMRAGKGMASEAAAEGDGVCVCVCVGVCARARFVAVLFYCCCERLY